MMRRVLIAIAGLFAAGVASVAILFGLAYRFTDTRLVQQWEAPRPSIAASTEPELIQRGRHLAQHVMLCAACHDKDLGGMAPYIPLLWYFGVFDLQGAATPR
jgi:mono/diheme cytochrome c family protein